ncbi:MAG: hypothetical protein QOD67_2185 [Caballeronia sp.]|jgi:hypothetical protein|nr:hypothetical protein [Caballeronia sp.]
MTFRAATATGLPPSGGIAACSAASSAPGGNGGGPTKIRMDVPVHLSFAETVKKSAMESIVANSRARGRHNSTAIRVSRDH